MKLNELKASIEGYKNLGGKIAGLETLMQTNKVELTRLAEGADLENAAFLDKIGRLRVQAELIPSRIAALESDFETARVKLLAATEEFTENTIQPKIKALRATAAEDAKNQLASTYSGNQLIHAVNSSDKIRFLDGIASGLNRDPEPSFPVDYALRRIAVLEQLSKI